MNLALRDRSVKNQGRGSGLGIQMIRTAFDRLGMRNGGTAGGEESDENQGNGFHANDISNSMPRRMRMNLPAIRKG